MPNKIIICPGFHPSELTNHFMRSLDQVNNDKFKDDYLIFPTTKYPAHSSVDLIKFLKENLDKSYSSVNLVFIAFSAGVVAAIGAANFWQLSGGNVKNLIALDGWGVPLYGNFPIARISHDYYTHWSSSLISQQGDSFYAQPEVNHLDLWRSPEKVWGWWEKKLGCRIRINQMQFIEQLLRKN